MAPDIVELWPNSSSGNKYALVVVDYFSKWPQILLPNQRVATIVAALLRESLHGVPLELHSDRGRSSKSAVFKKLMQLLRIKKTRTISLHSQWSDS